MNELINVGWEVLRGGVPRRLRNIRQHLALRVWAALKPYYLITEFPRSGGTWLRNMLLAGLPPGHSELFHGHYLPKSIHSALQKNSRVIVQWRDGRDVVVSLYYWCCFRPQFRNTLTGQRFLRKLPFTDYDRISDNMPKFIEFVFSTQIFPSFSWSDFVRRWHGQEGVIDVRYEELRQNTLQELNRIIWSLSSSGLCDSDAKAIIEEFSFEHQARKEAVKDRRTAFARKGIIGEWREVFTSEACEAFDFYAGEELITLGYELDRNWCTSSRTIGCPVRPVV